MNITCPNCKKPLIVEDNRKTLFCSYCGQKIDLSDDTIKMDIKTDHTIRWVNQAKLERERAEREERNKVTPKQAAIFTIASLVLLFLLLGYMSFQSIIEKIFG